MKDKTVLTRVKELLIARPDLIDNDNGFVVEYWRRELRETEVYSLDNVTSADYILRRKRYAIEKNKAFQTANYEKRKVHAKTYKKEVLEEKKPKEDGTEWLPLPY